jgi:hypothetical protein
VEKLGSGLSQALAQLGEDSRRAAMTALEAFLTFIDSVPEWERRNYEVSIWTLWAALKDLDDGRVVPMLSPNPTVHNRKPDPSMRKVVKAWAVIGVDILCEAGLSVTEACRIVAHKLETLSISLGGRVGTPSWKTVNGWRDRMTKLPPNDQAREVLDGLRPEIHRLKFSSPEEAKLFVAGQLRELIRTLGKTALE